MKTLADFDWTFNAKIPKTTIVELASARFVQPHAGVLLIGPPGVGKSHIATAIAVGAIRAGRACARRRGQTILTPPTAWPLFKRSSMAAFERSVTFLPSFPLHRQPHPIQIHTASVDAESFTDSDAGIEQQ